MLNEIKKIFLIGADGQLGSDLKKNLEKDYQIFCPLISDLDITYYDKIRKYIELKKPDLIINTAVYLANVDGMEINYEDTFRVNTLAVNNLAKICGELDIPLVHISSDYVFDGKKPSPYLETDLTNPINVYGASKIASEHLARHACLKHFIIRPAILFGKNLCRHQGNTNLVEKIIGLAKEGKEMKFKSDTYISPTYALELADTIKELIKTEQYGLYHITNDGFCTPHEFAKEVLVLTGLKANLIPVKTTEFEEVTKMAKRPLNSVLAHKNIKDLGLYKMSHWSVALKKYLKERKYV
jgi:dTDP-4-dehydrorhamnose reductase